MPNNESYIFEIHLLSRFQNGKARVHKLENVAKVATKNRQNRQMAKFRQTIKLKLEEHQILCGKLVSQASFEPRSPK